MQRQQCLDLIYRHTHPDFRGTVAGTKTLMVLRNGGGTLVPLDQLTEAEVSSLLPYAQAKEAKKRARGVA